MSNRFLSTLGQAPSGLSTRMSRIIQAKMVKLAHTINNSYRSIQSIRLVLSFFSYFEALELSSNLDFWANSLFTNF